MPVAAIAGWMGVALGTITIGAQALRVHREGTVGVNAMTWSLFLLMSAFWLAYGVAVRSPQIVAASVIGLPLFAWLFAKLEPRARSRGLWRATAAVTVVAFGPTAVLGWDAGLVGIGVLVVATRMPQLTQLVRDRHAHGVSAAAWLVGAASVALWLGYYAFTGKAFAAATMGAALATNVAIMAMVVVRHRAERAPSVSPALSASVAVAG